jgi:hypothetical protein
VPCLEKLKSLTQFQPKTMLPEIIDRVAEHLDPRKKQEFVSVRRETATAAATD